MSDAKRVPTYVQIAAICAMLFLVLPIIVVIPISFSSASYLQFPPKGFSLQWYQEYFSDPGWVDATFLSFRIAGVVMVLSTVIGTMASFAIVRGNFIGKSVLYALFVSPLIVPLVVNAVAMYFVLSQINLIGTSLGIIVAHTVITIPLAVVIMTATLTGFDTRLEHAASSLGANRFYVLRRVTLPIIAPGIAMAAILTFLTSFDEVVIALFISGTGAVTLPKKMWDGIWLEVTPTIAAASTILIAFAVLIFVCESWLQARGETLKNIGRR